MLSEYSILRSTRSVRCSGLPPTASAAAARGRASGLCGRLVRRTLRLAVSLRDCQGRWSGIRDRACSGMRLCWGQSLVPQWCITGPSSVYDAGRDSDCPRPANWQFTVWVRVTGQVTVSLMAAASAPQHCCTPHPPGFQPQHRRPIEVQFRRSPLGGMSSAVSG